MVRVPRGPAYAAQGAALVSRARPVTSGVSSERGPRWRPWCVPPHRRGPPAQVLHVHCYRMLGSLQDTEDAMQEVLLRAWGALPRLEGSEWLRAGLVQDRHERLSHRGRTTCSAPAARRLRPVMPIQPAIPGESLPASVWIEPYPDDGAVGCGDWSLAGHAGPRTGGGGVGVHRRGRVPPRWPACRADPARRPRLFGRRPGVADRHHRHRGEQHDATSPSDGRRTASRPKPAERPSPPRRRAHPQAS